MVCSLLTASLAWYGTTVQIVAEMFGSDVIRMARSNSGSPDGAELLDLPLSLS